MEHSSPCTRGSSVMGITINTNQTELIRTRSTITNNKYSVGVVLYYSNVNCMGPNQPKSPGLALRVDYKGICNVKTVDDSCTSN